MDLLEHLRAVRDDPADVEPLLAYSAWLEGQGDPLGEFIRLQCTLIGEGPARRAAVAEREEALRAAHEDAWLEPLRPAIDSFTWWRGMLGVDTTVGKFLAHAEALATSPLVRFIDISDWSADLAPGAWQRLADCPQLEWVTMLGVRGRYLYDGREQLLGAVEVEALAASPHTARLFHLDLGFNAIGDRGLVALASAPGLAGLTELALRGCEYGDTGLVALAQARFTGLELLELSYCEGKASAEGWSALLQTSQFPRLRQLWLLGNELPPEVRHAAQTRWGDRLRLAGDREL